MEAFIFVLVETTLQALGFNLQNLPMTLYLRLALVVSLLGASGAEAADKKTAKKADIVIKAAPVATRPVAAIA